MVFSSIPFIFFFLTLFLILYYITPFKYKNGVILVFSLFFYAWGEPVYILLMIVETYSDYLVGRFMQKVENELNSGDEEDVLRLGRRKKRLLIHSICFDLAVLAFFKYCDFLIGTVNGIFGLSVSTLNLALPLGISFFTFQSMSYVIDLYRGETKAEKSYAAYLTYVSMFPQLVAGPIVRYQTISKALHSRELKACDFVEGFKRFLVGLFKKVLLANQIGAMYELINAMPEGSASVLTMWLGAVAFTFQIYFDFSGYSDMAIGMGRMMGFRFDENFNYPLCATSVTDFWRRWHISLSTWFRNYVYIPLGGNRTSKIRHIRNIMVVWMLTGLWHGAAWNFVIWGLYYGILLLLEKNIYGKYLEKCHAFIRHFYAVVIVVVGFVIFSHDNMGEMITFLRGMIGLNHNSFASAELLWFLRNNAVIILGCIIFSIYPGDGSGGKNLPRGRFWGSKNYPEKLTPGTPGTVLGVETYPGDGSGGQKIPGRVLPVLEIAVYAVLFILSIACIVSDTYNPFLYFRF